MFVYVADENPAAEASTGLAGGCCVREGVASNKLGMLDAALRRSDCERIEMYARAAAIEIVWAGATLTLAVLDIVEALPILTRDAVDVAAQMPYPFPMRPVQLQRSLFAGSGSGRFLRYSHGRRPPR
jgi:hypothetical protein